MDFTLKCNSLKCRAQLMERAVVTTCSHIFCEECSDQLGLTSRSNTRKLCPACQTVLANPDDAVSTSLSPTEDYKTSILSGLSPNTIIECAGRGLAFWSYQCTQEVVYQEYLAKTLTDKYQTLNVQVDKIINEANVEIEDLNQKMSQMQMDRDKLKADNSALASALREKSRKCQQVQELYDRQKRKEMAAATQSAAFDSVDEVLQAAAQDRMERGHAARSVYDPNPRDQNLNTIRTSQRLLGRVHGNGSGERTKMPPPPAPLQRLNKPTPNQSFRTPGGERSEMPQHRVRLGGNISAGQQPPVSGRFGAPFTSANPNSTPFRRPFSETSQFCGSVTRAESSFGLSAHMRSGTHNLSLKARPFQ